MDFGLQRVTRCLRLLVEDKQIHVSHTFGSTKWYCLGASGPAQQTTEQRILAALAEGPATSDELAAKLSISNVYVREIINLRLRIKANRKVRVLKYLKQGKQRVKLFALGHMPDAPRPKPLSRAEISRLQRIRLKQDVEAVIKEHTRNVARHTKPKADPFMSQFAGLFGGSAKPATTNTISPLETV
jgi:hypothetical protein